MGQQAIVNQAAFDIGQMTEQKLRQRSRLKACAGTHIFCKIKPNRTEHHVYEKDNRLNLIWPRKRGQAVAQFWLLLDKCKGLVTLSWFLLFFDILVCFNPITIRCAQGRNPA